MADKTRHASVAADAAVNGSGPVPVMMTPWTPLAKPGMLARRRTRRALRKQRHQAEPSARWLRNAMLGLAVISVASATVSYGAQFLLVASAKGIWWIAALEAGLPDAGAAVFACLGIALAVHGKRALRARFLNVACVAVSIEMNYLASAGTGWRDTAIWVLPPVFYALASDTLIGVVRAMAVARQKRLNEALADDGSLTPLGVLGGLLMWVLRLVLAPRSTVKGFRAYVVEEVAFAPGRRAVTGASPPAGPRARPQPRADGRKSATRGRPRNPASKRQQLLNLIIRDHGSLERAVANTNVYSVADTYAAMVPGGYHPGTARRELATALAAGRRQITGGTQS